MEFITLAMTEAGRAEAERQIAVAGKIYSYAAIYTAMRNAI